MPQVGFDGGKNRHDDHFHQPDPRESRRHLRLARNDALAVARLKFFASVRLRVSRGEAIKNGTEQTGNRTKVSIPKNKIAPPFREAEFDLVYGKGINKYGDILDLGVKFNLIAKTGAWFTVGEERFQGRDQTRAYLEENPSIR